MLALFELLLSGRIDAISINVITANFLIGQRYDRDVKIVATSNELPMQIAFGVQKSAPLLVDIIDKVLVTTPPEVLDAMRRDAMRYRPTRLMSGLSDLETQSVLNVLGILLGLLTTGGGYLAWSVYRRKRQAAALRTELAHQDVLVNAVPFALFLRSRDGRLVSCNQLFADAFGLPRAAMLCLSGFPGAGAGDGNLGAELAALCRTLGQDGQPHFIDRRVRIGTDERDLYMWVIPARNQGPLAGALLGGWLDITARKCAERQLEVARMEAETANRAKTTFLATISHEIRTPMNAILGLLELELSEGRTPGKASLRTVRHTAESLLDLIDELLDYSKIEAGQLTVSPQPAAVGTELRRLAQMYRPLAREKGLAFQCRIDGAIPPVLMADPLRLRQVVGNLLGNALKFTDHGSVTLDAAWSAAAGRLQVRVEDTGCGIRQEDQARIFEPFEQATEGSAPRQKGTGLGLWICHSLIAQMGGSLLLASEHGKGSTFVATIPLEAAQELPQAAPVPPVPPDTAAQDISAALRVLVVDDHPANLELLPQQLRFLGISQVQTAENGMQALARLEASPFDIVLTDCSMPVMDGYALAAAIRGRPQWAGLVVVGFTADARHEAAERAVAAGMTACLTKPVGLDKLRWVLAAYGGQGAAASAPPPAAGNADDIHAALASLCGDNLQARTALLSTLVATNEEDRQAVHDLLASGDYEAAAARAHRIKGTGLFIGATSLAEVCQGMEAALRAHDPERSREWLSRLIAETERLHRQCEDILNGS
ncbi:Virulence sensor protein BvgS [compost metagenome]